MHIDPIADRALIATINSTVAKPEAPMPRLRPVMRTRNPSMQLLEAVMRLAGSHAEMLTHAERPWASATFQGSRHTITLCFTGAEAVASGEAFIAALPEHEFTIPRQLVADAAVTEIRHELLPRPTLMVETEVLLLQDC